MFTTSGVDSVATITEVRANTAELLDHAREHREAILIQKNNEPYAVLLDWDTYQELIQNQKKSRPPKQHRRSARKAPKTASRSSAA